MGYKKRKVLNSGKYQLARKQLHGGVIRTAGKPVDDCLLLGRLAKMVLDHFEARELCDRLKEIARVIGGLHKRSDISTVLTFRDGQSDDYRMLCKLRKFHKKIGHWHDVVDYRLIMIGKKVKEYDRTAKEHWNLKYGPKPVYKGKTDRDNRPPSMVDSILPVSIESRLDPVVRKAGIGFEPECGIAQQIKKEAVK